MQHKTIRNNATQRGCSWASVAWISRRACTLHVSLICLWACRTNAANNADCRFDCCTSTIHAAVKFSLIGDGRWPTHSHRDQSFGFTRPFSIVYTTSQDDTTLQHSAMQNSWVASQNVQHIKRAQHNATRENTIHMRCLKFNAPSHDGTALRLERKAAQSFADRENAIKETTTTPQHDMAPQAAR